MRLVYSTSAPHIAAATILLCSGCGIFAAPSVASSLRAPAPVVEVDLALPAPPSDPATRHLMCTDSYEDGVQALDRRADDPLRVTDVQEAAAYLSMAASACAGGNLASASLAQLMLSHFYIGDYSRAVGAGRLLFRDYPSSPHAMQPYAVDYFNVARLCATDSQAIEDFRVASLYGRANQTQLSNQYLTRAGQSRCPTLAETARRYARVSRF